MADISKINIKNEQYDIKDNIARSHIANTSNPHGVTAAQVGAATPAEVNAAVRKAAPRNLLDNSDFRNPVNQRGLTEYTSGYGIDRWIATGSNSRWSIVNGGLEVCTADAASKPYIDQRIPEKIVSYTMDNGKKYTVAVKVDGSIYSRIVTVGGSEVLNVPFGSIGFTYSPSASLMAVRFNLLTTDKHVIEWAALYEGEYTAETLPEFQPKGYGAELAECQRYYQKFDGAVDPVLVYSNSQRVLLSPRLHSPMRKAPTLAFKSLTWIRGDGSNITPTVTSTATYITNEYNPSYDLLFDVAIGITNLYEAKMLSGYELSADL